jgi:hypothetical protein
MSTAIKEPRLWDLVTRAGGSSIVLSVPGCYPPRPLNGVMVGCFLTPSLDSKYTYPAALKDEIADVVGEYLFDTKDFRTDDKEYLLRQVYEMTDRRFALAEHLLETKPWTLFAMVEMGPDRMHHGFWKDMDPEHRKHAEHLWKLPEGLLPAKVEMDVFYARHRSFARDLSILGWTFLAVLLSCDVAVHRETGRLSLRRRPSSDALEPAIAIAEIEHLGRLSMILRNLQDSSAQIRVRGALLFLIGFAVLAQLLGLEIILGAFIAGTVLRLVDKDGMMTHTLFRPKLEAVGFGVFIPFFFVTSGIQLDVGALLAPGGAALASVPVFLFTLLLVRGLPAILYRPVLGTRGVLAAALLQATSLPFIVAATGIGMELGILSPATGAALVVAGLLSVVLFPVAALTLLRGDKRPSAQQR